MSSYEQHLRTIGVGTPGPALPIPIGSECSKPRSLPHRRTLRSAALLLAHLAVEFSSAGDEVLLRRLALADEAVAMARRLGDPATLARVLEAGVLRDLDPRAT